MQPLDKDDHITILTSMASDYRQASDTLEQARQGLIEAVADAKAVGLTTADIVRLTGWSRSQVQGIAAYSVGSDAKQVPTDQAAGQPVAPQPEPVLASE
jgi:hypothetical protein